MLLIDRIGQLITFDTNYGRQLRGKEMNTAGIIENSAIVVEGEKIVAYGQRDKVLRVYGDRISQEVPADGALVTPGLVDAHTHSVFIGTRESEFEMRIKGKDYMEISKAGGGILNSARKLRVSPMDIIIRNSLGNFQKSLSHGVTTVEVKSGYGLSLEGEIKHLEAIATLSELVPQDVIATFMGAHEFPEEYRTAGKAKYVDIIINEMLPIIAQKKLARFCDVFCEKGVFEIDDTRKICTKAKELDFGIKLHADEITTLGGARLGVELGAISVDHLCAVSDDDIEVVAKSSTSAVLLPGTVLFLNLPKFAPARKLIDAGAIVSVATDFNPGSSPTTNLPLMMSIACTQMKMSPMEAWAAVTINGAYAVGMERIVGSISEGKQADILIWDADDFRQVPYFYGESLVKTVIKKGRIVFQR